MPFLLLRSSPRIWPPLLAAAWLADFAAFSLAGEGPPLLLSFCDTLEIALAAVLIRRGGGVNSPLFEGSTMVRIIAVSLAVPVLSATLAASVLVVAQDAPFFATWRDSYSAAALGLVIGAPFLLSWSDPQIRRKGLEQLTPASAALLLAATAVAGALVYQHSHAALLFLSFPVVFWLTWVYGLTGATMGVAAVTVSTLAAAVLGPRDVSPCSCRTRAWSSASRQCSCTWWPCSFAACRWRCCARGSRNCSAGCGAPARHAPSSWPP